MFLSTTTEIQAMLNQLTVGVTGGMQLSLPLFFPNPTTPLDDGVPGTGHIITLTIPNLETLLTGLFSGNIPPGAVTINADAPDLVAAAGNLDLNQILLALVDQFDFIFRKLDGALDKVLGYELPLVGVKLRDLPAFGSISDFVGTGSSALSGALTGTYTPETVRAALQNALNGIIPASSVVLNLTSGQALFHVVLGDAIHETVPLDADIGFAALGLDIDADLNVDFNWSIDFTMGASLNDGVFFQVGQSPELQVGLNIGLAPGSMLTGTLGFLEMTITDDPAHPTSLGGQFAIDFIDPGVGVFNDGRVTTTELGSFDFAQMFNIQVAGGAAAHLDLELSSQYDLDLGSLPFTPEDLPPISLPTILADLDAEWSLLDPTSPTVGFGNIRMDLGSFFESFGGPAFDAVNEAIEPIKPILDFLTRRIPVLSDIDAVVEELDLDGDGKVSLLDAVALLGGTTDTRIIAGLAYVVDLIDSVGDVNAATGGNSGFVIPLMPTLDLSGQDLGNAGGLTSFSVPEVPGFDLTAAINSLNAQPNGPAVAAAANTFVQKSNQVPSGFKFSLPILKDPKSAVGLLLGKDIDLFRLDLPAIDVHFSRSFGPYPVFGPIGVEFAGSMSLHADLAFGYDTVGARQFWESDFSAPAKLANGFFIYDRVDGEKNPTDQGTAADDKPELSFTGIVTASGGVAIPGFEAVIQGDITAGVTLDLPDGDQTTLADGKSRFNELLNCGINVQGTVSAGLGVKVSVGVSPIDYTVYENNIGRVTLLDYRLGCVVPRPLATLSNGILTLNVGNSGLNEQVSVSAAKDKQGQDVVRVQMFGVAEDFPRAQVLRIAGSFGDGNDSVHIEPELDIPAWLVGGDGVDILSGGGGNDAILGGRGSITDDGQGNP
ncbi:MAG TPA: hypothetical protein VIY86_11105, partial [Pirellulaceae bacterium]